MIHLESINQYYGGSHILRNVSLSAALGEVTVVLGRNGVGKTTLLKSLMGVVPVKTGTIHLDGVDITRDTPYQRVRKGVGCAAGARNFWPPHGRRQPAHGACVQERFHADPARVV